MLFIDYRKLRNDNEIKKLNDSKEILEKTIIIYNIRNYEILNENLNSIYYDYELNKNELKDKILFDLKNLIMNENIINSKYLLEKIIIKYDKKEIIIFKDNNKYINQYKINNEKIFNECIKFLNIENEKLNNYIDIINKYKISYNKEYELKEKIKKYEIELNKMKKENYKIKNELNKKFNYNLYYY